MKSTVIIITIVISAIMTGCTATHTAEFNGTIGRQNDIMITMGGIDQDYKSIGIVQITKTGAWLFGFIELVPADFEDAMNMELAEEAAFHGADAVINVVFYELQYPPLLKILSIFAVVSPQYAIVTGEMVEFVD